MLTKRIIPCLDVDKGQVVKGKSFINLVTAGDPVKLAKKYYDDGADELVFLDITASVENRKTILSIVEKVSKQVFIPLTIGGGIKSVDDIKILLNHGADKVSINTAAIKNPELIKKSSNKFGNQCIVVAIDAKQIKKNKWQIYTHGGRKKTGIDAIEWAKKMENLGAGEILLTSMDRDGTKKGFDLELLSRASNELNIPIIASGGAGNPSHFQDGVNIGKANALLAASIFHYQAHGVIGVKTHLKDKEIPVRL